MVLEFLSHLRLISSKRVIESLPIYHKHTYSWISMPGRNNTGGGSVYRHNGKMTRSIKATSDSGDDRSSHRREERVVREAYRKERKATSYLADDENFPSFKVQLAKMGLQLRDIPADG